MTEDVKRELQYLEHARLCFRNAADTRDPAAVARFADLGRRYLQVAHIDAAIDDEPVKERAAG